jgi:hypothetical protein
MRGRKKGLARKAEVRRHSDKSGGLFSRINGARGRLERRCDLFVYWCVY